MIVVLLKVARLVILVVQFSNKPHFKREAETIIFTVYSTVVDISLGSKAE